MPAIPEADEADRLEQAREVIADPDEGVSTQLNRRLNATPPRVGTRTLSLIDNKTDSSIDKKA